MPYSTGERVFLCDARQYGTITRTGLLGLKKSDSYAVTSDSGKNFMYTGDICRHVVCSKTSTNHCGSKFLLPLDIKTISSSILKDANIPPMKRSMFYVDFSKTSDEEHDSYRKEYNLLSSDEEEIKDFVMKLYNKFSH